MEYVMKLDLQIPINSVRHVSPFPFAPGFSLPGRYCTDTKRLGCRPDASRSEAHTSELQSLMRISYAVFSLKKKTRKTLLISTPTLNQSTITDSYTHYS